MKLSHCTIAVAALAALASLSPTLHAQSSSVTARVDVPFSFDYGKTHFAHGTYVITKTSRNTLTIQNATQVATMMAQASFDPSPVKSSVVIFSKYGDRYFLDELSIAGSDERVSVLQTQEEKQAGHELAKHGAEPTQVALALLPNRILGR